MNIESTLKKELPAHVVNELIHVADKYQKKGIILFLFGSFAAASNWHRHTSDLDIGLLWKSERKPHLFTQLYTEIQDLPTIRKIDLVDMEQVDKDFKNEVLASEILPLNRKPAKV
jgi:predicted nucleotidyltransferase